jgi:hypothetical protein
VRLKRCPSILNDGASGAVHVFYSVANGSEGDCTYMIVPDWLSLSADIGSLAGLLITIAVWFQTKAIRRSFVLKARLPELSRSLRLISSSLLENIDESSEAIARLDGLLISLTPTVDPPLRRIAIGLRKQCRGVSNQRYPWELGKKSPLSKEEAWAVYTGALRLLEAMNQMVKDSKWS